MLYLIEPATTALVAHSDAMRVLADISGDGTSNGAIMSIVRRVVLAVGAILGGVFAFKIITTYMGKADAEGKHKKLMNEARDFAIAEGLVAVVWVIAELSGNVFQGAGR